MKIVSEREVIRSQITGDNSHWVREYIASIGLEGLVIQVISL